MIRKYGFQAAIAAINLVGAIAFWGIQQQLARIQDSTAHVKELMQYRVQSVESRVARLESLNSW